LSLNVKKLVFRKKLGEAMAPINSNVILFMDNPLNCLANELELGRPFKKILSFEVYNGPFNKIEVLKEFETGMSF
jgi:hypothetical protein